jgi:beta-1,4-mannosyl-glycoprotein beta-1,4-N-acetylglucosaminyltransferase
MKIIDCFTFYNELGLLKYRLDTLNSVVDKFILVEALQTHAGNPKPLYYDLVKDTFFKEYADKIIHVIAKLPCENAAVKANPKLAWGNENFQRNFIEHSIHDTAVDEHDIFIISDVDEIPDPSLLKRIKDGIVIVDNVVNLKQDFYYYNITSKVSIQWYNSKLFTYAWFLSSGLTCDKLRHMTFPVTLENGGWHLSYFGDIRFIQNKIEQFAHTDLNEEHLKSTNNLQHSIQNKRPFFETDVVIENIPLESNLYIPPNIQAYITPDGTFPDLKNDIHLA